MARHHATLPSFGAAALVLLLAGCQERPKATSQAASATTATNTAKPAYTSPAVQEEAASSRSEIVGSAAPEFSLANQDGQTVALSSLRGQWVVLYFYPKDDTPGCTTEATEFTGLLDGGFRPLGARVLGVSADPAESHRSFRAKFDLGVDLLSDPEHKVMTSYGAWVAAALGDKPYGRVIRSTVLIDPTGIIRYHWPEVIPAGHAERVKEKLAELKAKTP